MSRAFTPKVITANALLEGDAIWFTETSEWTRDIAQAELITDAAHGDIRLLEAKADQSIVAGVYLADAKAGPNGPEPVHLRETFRTRGPSNYAHGKQGT
ncbi:MAG: DUF2849 domain-containing protein [Yoonia sp.]|nr:DUF2849 domain-containing protein [Yoonia sp.]